MRLFISGVVISLLLGSSVGSFASSHSPSDVISAFHKSLLSVLSRQSGNPDQARFDALEDLMDRTFDYQVMIRTVAGRQWRTAEAAEKAALQNAFRNVSIATYADQYAGLTDGAFEILGSRDGPRGLQFVDTKLVTSSREVLLTYVMRENEGRWQIIDVLLDGGKISELARKASEYSRTLKDGGVKALTTVLRDQKAELLAN